MSDAELSALVAASSGKEFPDRRDEAPPELGRFPQHVPLRKRNELSVRRRTHRERHVLRRSRFERADHTAEDESGRDVPQGRKLLCVPVGLGERHVAAPLQHLGCSRLTIRAHSNPRCLLPAPIGLLIDLSHAYIKTVFAGFVLSAAQLGCVVGQPTSSITCVG